MWQLYRASFWEFSSSLQVLTSSSIWRGLSKRWRVTCVFPERAAPYLAMPVILTELWIGLGLMIRRFRGAAALTASIVLLVFTFALLVNYIYAPGAVCGCWFTITLATSTPLHIALNVVLMALAISVLMSTLPIDDLHEVVMPAHAGHASKSLP